MGSAPGRYAIAHCTKHLRTRVRMSPSLSEILCTNSQTDLHHADYMHHLRVMLERVTQLDVGPFSVT